MNYAKETFRGLNNGFLATPPIKHLALRLERPTDYLLKREFIEKGILCLSLTHAHIHAHTRTLSLARTHTLSPTLPLSQATFYHDRNVCSKNNFGDYAFDQFALKAAF